MDTLTAIITQRHSANINHAHRVEKNFTREFSAIATEGPERGRALVAVRIYSTERTTAACVWIHSTTQNVCSSGSAKVGGIGYHRPSAAAAEAFMRAGIALSADIDGRGDDSIRAAVAATADALGIPYVTHYAHA